MGAQKNSDQPTDIWQSHLAILVTSYMVAANGLLILANTLRDQLGVHLLRPNFSEIGELVFSLPIFWGLTLLYLSVLLRRRKRTAWAVTLVVYAFIACFNLGHLLAMHHFETTSIFDHLVVDIVLPAVIIGILSLFDDEFTVKSDIRGFGVSLRFVSGILSVAFIYGVAGFMLMDKHDFHQDIGLIGAMHHTIDQFGLTTRDTLTAFTRRAQLFTHSLNVISVVAVGYAFLSFFQPLRARFSDQSENRILAESLLARYHGDSDDFFKLWPHDKYYFFNSSQSAGLAYAVKHGIVLVVGDPMGDPKVFDQLLDAFDDFCRANDWQVAYIHITPRFRRLYEARGFNLQQIGEEAVVNLDHFKAEVANNKYFRQINNRFTKQNYTAEMLHPPHSQALLSRLAVISRDWLQQPGRSERGFMLGSFNEQYMQLCSILVLRDQAGTIQAFVNQVPSYDPEEANFDLLRHTKEALGNSNDSVLLAFIDLLHKQGFKRLNLGLCPLSGLNDDDQQRNVINNALRFMYANGDRFYSFSGLHRFKAKYDPEWQDRYIAYRGGVRSFTKTLNALNRATRVRQSK